MKKTLLSAILLLGITQLTNAQSATILPSSSSFAENIGDFISTSTAPNAFSLRAALNTGTPGTNSAAIFGANAGANSNGSGVRGSHSGSGYGVYGSSVGNAGVYGTSFSGVGIRGISTFDVGVHGYSNNYIAGKFEIAGTANANAALVGLTNSTADYASAISGTISATNPGAFSAAVKGFNNATSGYGIGIWGSHAGSGWGIYGVAPTGAGVYGNASESGTGVLANSYSGVGLRAASSYGRPGVFEINLNLNNSTVLTASTNGDGAGIRVLKTNATGVGAGVLIEKADAYEGAYTFEPHAELEVRHGAQSTFGMTGLRIVNTSGGQNSWTLYTNGSSDGHLYLYYKSSYKGNFDSNTGAYTNTSDVRLKQNLKTYKSTLANLMKVDVKSYQLLNSNKTEVGLIAQEVLKYFPEIVYNNTDEKGGQFYSMDYARIGVIAVKAIQEQQQEIDELKLTQQKEIKKLKQNQQRELDELKKELAEIRALVKKR